MKIVGASFEKMKILIFSLCELPSILRVDRKRKKEVKIFAGIECERDRQVGLGATLGDGLKIKNNFSSFRDFSGKSR